MLSLPSGRIIPSIGLGMWYLGEDASSYFKEIELIRQALEIGYRAFDTAEMYGEGGAEEVLGEAVADCRKKVFLTSKVSSTASSYEKIIESCEKSLDRLQTDYLDMYLLHRGCCHNNPEEALEAFIDLKNSGRILNFGVAHFDLSDLEEWLSFKEASETAMNQIYFNPCRYSLEQELLPYCKRHKMPLIAYSPLDVCSIAYENPVLCKMAQEHNASPRQIILAWLLAEKNVGVLIKALTQTELQEYYDAGKVSLSRKETKTLSALFPLC